MLSVDDERAVRGANQPKWLLVELMVQSKPGVLSEDLTRAANRAISRKWLLRTD